MKLGVASLVLSTIALAVVLTSTQDSGEKTSRASAPDNRIIELSAKVEQLTAEVRTLKAERRTASHAPSPDTVRPTEAEDDRAIVRDAEPDALAKAVDKAVERKTQEVIEDLRIKADKKPQMAVFARALELTDEQRVVAERIVLESQRATYSVLETPTADGTNLMTELVDLFAHGIADSSKDPGWGKWIGRIVTEKIPGTDETYSERLETIKRRVNGEFKRTWTPEQYKEYEAWGVNPTEIKGVPESPEVELAKRIMDRARMFGAESPEDK
jgi:hypothetical protein